MTRLVPALLATAFLAGCGSPPQGSTPYAPSAGMTKVLTELQAMHTKRPTDVSLSEARDIPDLAAAQQAMSNVVGLPADSIVVAQYTQPTASGAAGPITASLYRPALAKDVPVIIYYPGGTWATRQDVGADETSRQLAARTGYIVLSLRPRLAPDVKFPAIHDDAFATYQWARAQIRAWGGDPTRVILAGEGPGANLALSTALQARDQAASGHPVALPDYLVLITPWAGTDTGTQSMSENSGSQPLTRSTVRWANRQYASGHLDDPRIDLARRSDFQQMPPTVFVLAEIDPLRSGAQTVADRMQAAGVRTDVKLYRGVTYDFFGLGATVPEAATAEDDVARTLKAAFYRPPPAPPLPSRQPVSRSRARR